MPYADAVAFLREVMRLDEGAAGTAVYNAWQSSRPYRVF